jgi:lipopolysaccharide biosynthesis glycosyltransferase
LIVRIVCGADDTYALPLAVTLHTALESLDGGPVQITVVDGGIEDDSKRRLARVVRNAPPDADLQWAQADLSAISDLPTHNWINTTTYLRLFIPQVLPDHADRVLYLDSDLQVEDNLRHLWEKPLDGQPIGAVRAYGTPYVSSDLGIEKYAELGYGPETPYFNAGVLVIDLDRWRSLNVSRRVVDYLRTYEEHVQMVDQEGLNAVLADQWKRLDLRWNVMSHLVNFDDWDPSSFKRRVRPRRTSLLRDAAIYHYAGGSKPWQIGCVHPAQLEWVGHLWNTGWFSPAERASRFGEWFSRYAWWRLKKQLGVL